MFRTVFYSDAWGDHASVTLLHRGLYYRVTTRLGDQYFHSRHLWFAAAEFAFDSAVEQVEQFINVIRNGIPERRTWPPM